MSNDEKAKAILEATVPELLIIKELIDSNGIDYQDVMRALVLIANVKKLAQWGKITFLLKDGEIVSIQQEQQFITTRELERIK
jgi:hypothetical protein